MDAAKRLLLSSMPPSSESSESSGADVEYDPDGLSPEMLLR